MRGLCPGIPCGLLPSPPAGLAGHGREEQSQPGEDGDENKKKDAMLLKEINGAKLGFKDLHHYRCGNNKQHKDSKAPENGRHSNII